MNSPVGQIQSDSKIQDLTPTRVPTGHGTLVPRRLLLVLLVILSVVGGALSPIALAQKTGGGVCRSKGCPCTKDQLQQGWQQSAKGCCNKAEIDRLRGRIRGLKEAADAHRKDFNKTTAKQDCARDGIWGGRGSLAKFSNATLAMAGGGEGAGKIAGWASVGIGISQEGVSLSTWVDGGLEVAGNEKVQNAVLEQATADAEQTALDYLKESPEDFQGAARIYYKTQNEAAENLETLGKGADILAQAKTTWEFIASANKLYGGISEYLLAREDAEALQGELDKIDRDIDSTSKQITSLLKDCGNGAAADGSSLPGSGPGPSQNGQDGKGDGGANEPPCESAESSRNDGSRWPPRLSWVGTHPPRDTVDVKQVKSAKGRLHAVQVSATRLTARLNRRVLPALAPWAFGGWKKMPPRLLREIVRHANKDLQSLPKDMRTLVAGADEVRQALGAARMAATTDLPLSVARLPYGEVP